MNVARMTVLGPLAAAFGLALTALALPSAPTSSAAEVPQLATSPDNQVMVVSVNIAEMYHKADNDERRELGNLARRLKREFVGQNLAMPDVVLLQEATQESAQSVAKLLSQYLYDDSASTAFQVVVSPAPGKGAIHNNTSDPRERRESGVLLNTKTMAPGTGLSESRKYLSLNSAESDNRSTFPWTWNHVASFRAVEKDGTGRVLASSARMPKNGSFKATSADGNGGDGTALGVSYKGKWANKIIDLQQEMPKPTHIVAGDFNCKDKRVQPETCGNTPLWTAFTTRGYTPTLPATRIDQFFVESNRLVAAGDDATYRADVIQGAADPGTAFSRCADVWTAGEGYSVQGGAKSKAVSQGCYADFYSDHAYTWALVRAAP